jgi:hypothetical protein
MFLLQRGLEGGEECQIRMHREVVKWDQVFMFDPIMPSQNRADLANLTLVN